MICPKCKQTLSRAKYAGANVRQCANCLGILLKTSRAATLERRVNKDVPELKKEFETTKSEDLQWFQSHLNDCVLICLDHDLGPNRDRDGRRFDPGIGRDVADMLASCEPVCPIVIHTTNTIARPGMIQVLQ